VPGVSPVFLAQSVSVLAFIHERDAALVARLADETSRGVSIESVLASSTTLPHDVAGLDAAWRQWLERNQKVVGGATSSADETSLRGNKVRLGCGERTVAARGGRMIAVG
jgi:hypothetical protein